MFYIDTQQNPTAKILAVIYFNGKRHEIINEQYWKGATINTVDTVVVQSSPKGSPIVGNSFDFTSSEGGLYYMLITDGCSGDNEELLNHLNDSKYPYYLYRCHGNVNDSNIEVINFHEFLSNTDIEKLKEILTSHLSAKYLVDQVEKITEETEVIPKVTTREVFVCVEVGYGESEFTSVEELQEYLYNQGHIDSTGKFITEVKIFHRKIEEVQIELQVKTTVSYKEI